MPGAAGPALLDDMSSLGVLSQLDSSPELSWDVVNSNSSGVLGRRIPMATFVLERLWGDGSVATTKRVNILIHLINGVLVYWFLLLMLSFLPSVRYPSATALVCTALWLLTPLQVSTVLYQVQRMAMLAATFCLLSLIAYLYWRRGLMQGNASIWYLGAALFAGFLGVFSKENAIVFVPLLLVVEIFWLEFESGDGKQSVWLKRITVLLVFAGAALVILYLLYKFDSLNSARRDFTLEERVLTQFRIVWDYVRQFFVPDMSRLGLYHDDFEVSKSLFTPPSTFWAGMSWIVLLGMCLGALYKACWRRLAIGPIFFVVGHSIESTVWPLELYFEHRNYLPSIGLAVLVLSLVCAVPYSWRMTKKPLLVGVGLYSFYLSLLTSSQVTIWSNSYLLSLQHVVGHPESARANRDLAHRMSELGALNGALEYSERAYRSAKKHTAASDEHHGDFVLRNIALACIARAPLSLEGIQSLGSVDPGRPMGDVATMKVVVDLYYAERCPEFDWKSFADHLTALYLLEFDTGQASAKMFAAMAMLANALERWEDAYAYTKRSLALKPDDVQSLLMQLHFTYIIDQRVEFESIKNRLLQLQLEDRLTLGERETLALYLEY